MNEPLERWGEAAPDLFRAAASVYDQDGPSERELARMFTHVELNAPESRGLGILSNILSRLSGKLLLSVVAVVAFGAGAALLSPRKSPEFGSRADPGAATERRQGPQPAQVSSQPEASTVAGEGPTARVEHAMLEPLVSTPATSASVVRTARKTKQPAHTPPAPPDAAAELALLVRARRILTADPTRAYALTEEHRATYRRGELSQERELLAIEALSLLARRDDALARAAQFSRSWPDSVHARRLALILQKAPP